MLRSARRKRSSLSKSAWREGGEFVVLPAQLRFGGLQLLERRGELRVVLLESRLGGLLLGDVHDRREDVAPSGDRRPVEVEREHEAGARLRRAPDLATAHVAVGRELGGHLLLRVLAGDAELDARLAEHLVALELEQLEEGVVDGGQQAVGHAAQGDGDGRLLEDRDVALLAVAQRLEVILALGLAGLALADLAGEDARPRGGRIRRCCGSRPGSFGKLSEPGAPS